MPINIRHGRRLPLPSVRQIRHELLTLERLELEQKKALLSPVDAAPPLRPSAI